MSVREGEKLRMHVELAEYLSWCRFVAFISGCFGLANFT